jgi:hypothetical protein
MEAPIKKAAPLKSCTDITNAERYFFAPAEIRINTSSITIVAQATTHSLFQPLGLLLV